MTSPAASGQQLSKFEKRPNMPHPTALGRISPDQFKRIAKFYALFFGDSEFHKLTGHDITSCFQSDMQNAITYCTKVRKTGAVSKESNDSANV